MKHKLASHSYVSYYLGPSLCPLLRSSTFLRRAEPERKSLRKWSLIALVVAVKCKPGNSSLFTGRFIIYSLFSLYCLRLSCRKHRSRWTIATKLDLIICEKSFKTFSFHRPTLSRSDRRCCCWCCRTSFRLWDSRLKWTEKHFAKWKLREWQMIYDTFWWSISFSDLPLRGRTKLLACATSLSLALSFRTPKSRRRRFAIHKN